MSAGCRGSRGGGNFFEAGTVIRDVKREGLKEVIKMRSARQKALK